MSGFAAVVGPNVATIPVASIDAATRRLSWRGPDASGRWCDANAFLLHSMFRTTDESANEHQPLGDSRFQLVGDVRLDSRNELIAKLTRAGKSASAGAPDIELVFHAWNEWGNECVTHLRGDFSFVVWDRADRRLFGARDQFGVRPFFYARANDRLLIANDLAALRAFGLASEELDDATVVDMLAFGQPQSPDATVFSTIKRLPGGHTLTWHNGQLDVCRYWQGIAERPIRFKKDADYLDAYRDQLTRAVTDRLRTPRVGVTLTGGLDSASIAAVAVGTDRSNAACSIHGYTIVYDELIPDRERQFAGLVSKSLGIPTTFVTADGHHLYEGQGAPAEQAAEPVDNPFRGMHADFYRRIAADGRVLLMGLDGDTLLCEVASDYLLAQLRRGRMGEYVRGVRDYVRTRGELPPHRVRSSVRRWLRKAEPLDSAAAPAWLNPDLAKRFQVNERWQARRSLHDRLQPGWPLRPRATTVMSSPVWSSMFDEHDAASLDARLEVRYPLADLALAEFLLNIPAVPWCIDKFIVRRAFANRLPDEVLARPKTPLAGDPVAACFARGDVLPWPAGMPVHRELARYVQVDVLAARMAAGPGGLSVGVDTRALILNEWLWYHRPRS